MAISTFAAYKNYLNYPGQSLKLTKSSLSASGSRMTSLWTTSPFVGSTPATPSTASALTRTSAGAFGQFNTTSTQRLGRIVHSGLTRGMLIIADRLSHQGGLSGTTTTPQTTNLPTAALTRYTSGVGVWAGIEIYTSVGGTGTTINMSYTNQAGVSGQTSESTIFGGSGFREAGRIILPGLAQGDTGVRAVASVTVAASTLTSGNFGITLFKPLMMMPIEGTGQSLDFNGLIGLGGQLSEILTDACLFWIYVQLNAGAFSVDMSLIEE